jgi:hypothetical protein
MTSPLPSLYPARTRGVCTCPVCGETFPMLPSGKEKLYCSSKCRGFANKGAPPGSPAAIRSRGTGQRCEKCHTVYLGKKCGRCA